MTSINPQTQNTGPRSIQDTEVRPVEHEDAPANLEVGSTGEEVRELQKMLGDQGYLAGDTGSFDARTDEAVRRFQRDHALVVDGIVGPQTREALSASEPRSAAQRALSELPANTHLRWASSGEGVRRLQNALNANGANLEVDGKYGRATTDAVQRYQEENGLKIDGIAGPETIGSLVQKPGAEVSNAPAIANTRRGKGPRVPPPNLHAAAAAAKANQAIDNKNVTNSTAENKAAQAPAKTATEVKAALEATPPPAGTPPTETSNPETKTTSAQGEMAKNEANKAADGDKSGLGGMIDAMSRAGQDLSSGLQRGVNQIGQNVGPAVQDAIDDVSKAGQNIASGVQKGIDQIGQNVGPAMQGAIDDVSKAGQNIASGVQKGIDQIGQNVGPAVQGAIDDVSKAGQNIASGVQKGIDQIGQNVGPAVQGTIDDVSKAGQNLASGVQKGIDQIGQNVGPAMQGAIDDVSKAGQNIASGVQKGIDQIGQNVGPAVQGAIDDASKAGQNIASGVQKGIDQAGQSLGQMSSQIQQGLQGLGASVLPKASTEKAEPAKVNALEIAATQTEIRDAPAGSVIENPLNVQQLRAPQGSAKDSAPMAIFDNPETIHTTGLIGSTIADQQAGRSGKTGFDFDGEGRLYSLVNNRTHDKGFGGIVGGLTGKLKNVENSVVAYNPSDKPLTLELEGVMYSKSITKTDGKIHHEYQKNGDFRGPHAITASSYMAKDVGENGYIKKSVTIPPRSAAVVANVLQAPGGEAFTLLDFKADGKFRLAQMVTDEPVNQEDLKRVVDGSYPTAGSPTRADSEKGDFIAAGPNELGRPNGVAPGSVFRGGGEVTLEPGRVHGEMFLSTRFKQAEDKSPDLLPLEAVAGNKGSVGEAARSNDGSFGMTYDLNYALNNPSDKARRVQVVLTAPGLANDGPYNPGGGMLTLPVKMDGEQHNLRVSKRHTGVVIGTVEVPPGTTKDLSLEFTNMGNLFPPAGIELRTLPENPPEPAVAP